MAKVLLLGWNNKIWTSEDNAKTFKHQAITDDDKEVVRSLIPHPSDPDKVLAGIQTGKVFSHSTLGLLVIQLFVGVVHASYFVHAFCFTRSA